MSEDNQAKFNGWAKVEIMGHQSHIGYVTTEAYGQAVMFRVEQPEIPEREETLAESGWCGNQRVPAGTVVKHAKIEAASVLVGSASIYRMIPCTEAVAIKAIIEGQRRPLMLVRLPELPLLAEPARKPDEVDEGIDEDDDPYEEDLDDDHDDEEERIFG